MWSAKFTSNCFVCLQTRKNSLKKCPSLIAEERGTWVSQLLTNVTLPKRLNVEQCKIFELPSTSVYLASHHTYAISITVTVSAGRWPHSIFPAIVIAKRRIGHSAVEIRDFILQTDLDGLSGEYCELLLKFIPTEDEVRIIVYHQSL